MGGYPIRRSALIHGLTTDLSILVEPFRLLFMLSVREGVASGLSEESRPPLEDWVLLVPPGALVVHEIVGWLGCLKERAS